MGRTGELRVLLLLFEMSLPGAERAIIDLDKLSMEDLPEKGLQHGQVGTVVEDLAPGLYEVEFSDDQGRMYASAAPVP